MLGLPLVAIAPLISVQPLILDAPTVTLIIVGFVLFCAGFLKRHGMHEIPLPHVAAMMTAACILLLAMLL
jgi:hypothetical protein